MPTLIHIIPDAETVLSMSVPDLAGYVLESLISPDALGSGNWHRRNFTGAAMQEYAPPRTGGNKDVAIAISEAWSWLEANGLICRNPEQDNDWFVPTRLGRSANNHKEVRKMVGAAELPERFLHPELLLHARPLFLQSRFDTAVFEAFKALEVAIRDAAGLGAGVIGVALAQTAFSSETGRLADLSAEKGERVALMNLVAGALGSYKNPSSHRRVLLSAAEAREMILLASHLLRIVDARRLKHEDDA